MNEFRSRPLNFPWPPFIYLAACLAAVFAQRLMPLPIFVNVSIFAQAFGGLFILSAVFLDLWALKTLSERHTTVMPHRCATHLVTCGPFRYSRNPIYLGYTLMTTGIGLVLNNGWFIAAALIAALATSYLAIRREESHLLSRFGFEFERYCRTTRRWI
jgi:protein-S-isoprenylcysteine O-methyltransferase Ste14